MCVARVEVLARGSGPGELRTITATFEQTCPNAKP